MSNLTGYSPITDHTGKIHVPKSLSNHTHTPAITDTEVKQYIKDHSLKGVDAKPKRVRHDIRIANAPVGRDVSFTDTNTPRQLVYGTCMVPGFINFITTDGSGNQNLYLGVILAGHTIDQVVTLYLDSNAITFNSSTHWSNGPNLGADVNYANLVYMRANKTGDPDQTAQAELTAAMVLKGKNLWDATHRCQYCAFAYIKLVWNGIVFANGMPNLEFLVNGKPVYDPRTGQTAFTDTYGKQIGKNAALVIADFLMDKTFGYEALSSEIDMSANVGGLQWAANICDQAVNLAAGGTEPRYQVNGYTDTDTAPSDTLHALEQAMAGFVVFTGGLWKFYPGAWPTPINITLTEDNLRGTPKVETLIARDQNFNSVRGTFVSADKGFVETDFPSFSSNQYVSADNGVVVWKDFTLPFTTSSTMAQRIVKIELEEIRRQQTITAPFDITAYPLEVGDVCYCTFPRFGLTAQTFRVEEWGFQMSQTLEPEIILTLRRCDANVFNWDPSQNEQTIHPLMYTLLPVPSQAGNPSGLALASGTQYLDIRSDGTVFTRLYCSWTPPTDSFVLDGGSIQIQYKKSSSSTWLDFTPVPGNSTYCYILDVLDGVQYDVQIRSKNALGTANTAWVQVLGYTVVGKNQPPTNVPSLSAALDNANLVLTWGAVPDADLKLYELRSGTVWATGALITQTKTLSYRMPFQAGSLSFMVKAVDTSGNYSTALAAASISLALPGTPNNFTGRQIDNNVILSWQASNPGTLPIASFNVYKGATFAGATLLGNASATSFVYIEQVGGGYTYWVTAVDAIGNESTGAQVYMIVANPPDFILQYDQIFNLTGALTLTNVLADPSGTFMELPAVTGLSWTNYFSTEGWSTIAAMVAAGFTYLFQPSPSTAVYEQVLDCGSVLPGSTIVATWNQVDLVAGVVITPLISVSATSATGPWTDQAAWQSQVYAANFRYVKLKLSAAASTNKMLATLNSVRVRVSVKKQSDSGTLTITATGGTKAYFNLNFLSIISMSYGIQSGSTSVICVHDVIGANPTYATLHLLDKTGAETTGTVTWTAQGLVNVLH